MTQELLAWFDRHQRPLPWRRERTPYRVWLAEMMLLQTQVATVIPYYQRWLARFPTLEALAGAPLEAVLKAWEGLGYYRRARYLHQAAQRMLTEGIPQGSQGWRRLPGVGPYAAAAIAAIVDGEPVIAVDGNVRRVAARLFALDDLRACAVQAALAPYLPHARPGAFNEALMELGATICKARNPACSNCPLQDYCQAYQTGSVAQYPKRQARAKIPHHRRYALIWRSSSHIALRRRSDDEMLGGLWGFVLSDTAPNHTAALAQVKHAYTHFRLTVTPLLVGQAPAGSVPVAISELDTLALSTLDRKILKRLGLD